MAPPAWRRGARCARRWSRRFRRRAKHRSGSRLGWSRSSESFPFSPAGAALLCSWAAEGGLERIDWVNVPDEGESFNATVGLVDECTVLRFAMSDEHDAQLAAAAASAVNTCLRNSSLELGDVDAIVAAPARSQYRATLATHLEYPRPRSPYCGRRRQHRRRRAVPGCRPSAIDRGMRRCAVSQTRRIGLRCLAGNP